MKIPPNNVCVVPVVPESLQWCVVCRAHAISGHGIWEAAWKVLRAECYFPHMS